MQVEPVPAPAGTVRWSNRTYDALAEAYDAANPRIRPGLKPFADRLVGHAGATGLIADVGCGTGRDMAWMVRQGARVVGIDSSRGMLAHAARNVAGPLVQGDIRRLPLVDGALAGCWCVATVLHLPPDELPLAMAELRRVLQLGGLLVLGTQRGTGAAREPDPYTGRFERLMTRYPDEQVIAAAAAAGFTGRLEQAVSEDVSHWVLLTAMATREWP